MFSFSHFFPLALLPSRPSFPFSNLSFGPPSFGFPFPPQFFLPSRLPSFSSFPLSLISPSFHLALSSYSFLSPSIPLSLLSLPLPSSRSWGRDLSSRRAGRAERRPAPRSPNNQDQDTYISTTSRPSYLSSPFFFFGTLVVGSLVKCSGRIFTSSSYSFPPCIFRASEASAVRVRLYPLNLKLQ